MAGYTTGLRSTSKGENMEITYDRTPVVIDTVFTGMYRREPHHILSELNKMVCSLKMRFSTEKQFDQAMAEIGIDGATITEYIHGVRSTTFGRVSEQVLLDCVIAVSKHGSTRLCLRFDREDKQALHAARNGKNYIPIRPAWECGDSMWIRCVYDEIGTGMGCKWVEMSDEECEALFDSWEAPLDV